VNSVSTFVNRSDVIAWHSIAADEALKLVDSNAQLGLAASDVSGRLEKFGHNRLPEGSKRGPLKRFLMQLNNVLVYVLLAAGFVKLMVGVWLDAGIIFCVVLINSLLGFVQEGRAEKALDAIRNMLSGKARTLRDGQVRIVPSEDLVPGDVVLLESGDKVPAGLRLIDATRHFR